MSAYRPRIKQQKLNVGDRVMVIKSYKNEHRIGRMATVLRQGFHMWWIKFDDGQELVWRTNWLQRIPNEQE